MPATILTIFCLAQNFPVLGWQTEFAKINFPRICNSSLFTQQFIGNLQLSYFAPQLNSKKRLLKGWQGPLTPYDLRMALISLTPSTGHFEIIVNQSPKT